MTDRPDKQPTTPSEANPQDAPPQQPDSLPVEPEAEDKVKTKRVSIDDLLRPAEAAGQQSTSPPAETDGGETVTGPAQPEEKVAAKLPVETPESPASKDASEAVQPAAKPAGREKDETLPPGTTAAALPVTEAPAPAVPAVPDTPDKPASSAGITCPSCKHRNRPGVLICENCGTNLTTGQQPTLGTRDLKREQEAVQEGEKLLDTGQTRAVESAGSGTFTEVMALRVEIEGAAAPMIVYPKQEIIMGRRDPNTGAMPDVDLTAYAGYRMGVSRRHAAIRYQDKQLHLSDLGSSNGTFLNGTRLTAHRPYQVRDGDEIRLGQMMLRVFFQSGRK